MKIVKENISEFERGIGVKRGLGIGSKEINRDIENLIKNLEKDFGLSLRQMTGFIESSDKVANIVLFDKHAKYRGKYEQLIDELDRWIDNFTPYQGIVSSAGWQYGKKHFKIELFKENIKESVSNFKRGKHPSDVLNIGKSRFTKDPEKFEDAIRKEFADVINEPPRSFFHRYRIQVNRLEGWNHKEFVEIVMPIRIGTIDDSANFYIRFSEWLSSISNYVITEGRWSRYSYKGKWDIYNIFIELKNNDA